MRRLMRSSATPAMTSPAWVSWSIPGPPSSSVTVGVDSVGVGVGVGVASWCSGVGVATWCSGVGVATWLVGVGVATWLVGVLGDCLPEIVLPLSPGEAVSETWDACDESADLSWSSPGEHSALVASPGVAVSDTWESCELSCWDESWEDSKRQRMADSVLSARCISERSDSADASRLHTNIIMYYSQLRMTSLHAGTSDVCILNAD